MISCSSCAFWVYHSPSPLGICSFHPENAEGVVAPASADAVGVQLAIEYLGSTATSAETLCDNWEPDSDEAWEELMEGEEDD